MNFKNKMSNLNLKIKTADINQTILIHKTLLKISVVKPLALMLVEVKPTGEELVEITLKTMTESDLMCARRPRLLNEMIVITVTKVYQNRALRIEVIQGIATTNRTSTLVNVAKIDQITIKITTTT